MATHRGASLVALRAEDAPLRVATRARDAPLSAPTVGDWVLVEGDPSAPRIGHILPRTSVFVRKEAGRRTAPQPIAANIDVVLVVTAVGEDLSAGRIERYITAIHAGGATPLVVVNKADRSHDARAIDEIRDAAPAVEVIQTSTLEPGGLDALFEAQTLRSRKAGEPPKTLALVGSSGVGKTSIVNAMLGTTDRPTTEARDGDDKGRHTTTHRELCATERGLLVIDTPGMREFALWDAASGLADAFPDITSLAAGCRFTDCRHDSEPGCALIEALEQGLLPRARLARYERLLREVEATDARAMRDRKEQWKSIHKAQRARNKLDKKLGLKGW